jgi:hypothetical protein
MEQTRDNGGRRMQEPQVRLEVSIESRRRQRGRPKQRIIVGKRRKEDSEKKRRRWPATPNVSTDQIPPPSNPRDSLLTTQDQKRRKRAASTAFRHLDFLSLISKRKPNRRALELCGAGCWGKKQRREGENETCQVMRLQVAFFNRWGGVCFIFTALSQTL